MTIGAAATKRRTQTLLWQCGGGGMSQCCGQPLAWPLSAFANAKQVSSRPTVRWPNVWHSLQQQRTIGRQCVLNTIAIRQ